MPKPKRAKSPIEDLVKALNADEAYRESWKANIVMSMVDCAYSYKLGRGRKYRLSMKQVYFIANLGADRFLEILCAPSSK